MDWRFLQCRLWNFCHGVFCVVLASVIVLSVSGCKQVNTDYNPNVKAQNLVEETSRHLDRADRNIVDGNVNEAHEDVVAAKESNRKTGIVIIETDIQNKKAFERQAVEIRKMQKTLNSWPAWHAIKAWHWVIGIFVGYLLVMGVTAAMFFNPATVPVALAIVRFLPFMNVVVWIAKGFGRYPLTR